MTNFNCVLATLQTLDLTNIKQCVFVVCKLITLIHSKFLGLYIEENEIQYLGITVIKINLINRKQGRYKKILRKK